MKLELQSGVVPKLKLGNQPNNQPDLLEVKGSNHPVRVSFFHHASSQTL
jgi:hypothetical protein